mmetsp:Transcript_42705/g.136757  ORF Transcript_42705/g.136757 Transcript_42705/m.136757 type:complete len:312 (+) Transcript_42705:451-1386(+)
MADAPSRYRRRLSSSGRGGCFFLPEVPAAAARWARLARASVAKKANTARSFGGCWPAAPSATRTRARRLPSSSTHAARSLSGCRGGSPSSSEPGSAREAPAPAARDARADRKTASSWPPVVAAHTSGTATPRATAPTMTSPTAACSMSAGISRKRSISRTARRSSSPSPTAASSMTGPASTSTAVWWGPSQNQLAPWPWPSLPSAISFSISSFIRAIICHAMARTASRERASSEASPRAAESTPWSSAWRSAWPAPSAAMSSAERFPPLIPCRRALTSFQFFQPPVLSTMSVVSSVVTAAMHSARFSWRSS